MKVDVEDAAKSILDILNDYVGVTEEAAGAGVIKTAEWCVEQLRQAHPDGSGDWSSWDEYNSGWNRTKLKADKKKGYTDIVHNQHYQLTHLLENGHALVNGGRARAFPHIAPVAEKAEDILIENIKKQI